MKRTTQVNVKMTQDEFDFLQNAAAKRWPDAVMTNSGIVRDVRHSSDWPEF